MQGQQRLVHLQYPLIAHQAAPVDQQPVLRGEAAEEALLQRLRQADLTAHLQALKLLKRLRGVLWYMQVAQYIQAMAL